jgi:hypothetical protein
LSFNFPVLSNGGGREEGLKLVRKEDRQKKKGKVVRENEEAFKTGKKRKRAHTNQSLFTDSPSGTNLVALLIYPTPDNPILLIGPERERER